jgi:hypothetical protein
MSCREKSEMPQVYDMHKRKKKKKKERGGGIISIKFLIKRGEEKS